MVKELEGSRERVQRAQEGTGTEREMEIMLIEYTREVKQEGGNGQKRFSMATPNEENSG